VAWEEDDCVDCEDTEPIVPSFEKLYCRPYNVRYSEMTKKLTLTVETRTHSSADLETVVFYNTSLPFVNQIDSYKRVIGIDTGDWINIYYNVDNTSNCHILYVEKALASPGDVNLRQSDLVLIILLIAVISFLGGLFVGWITG
jgi:hypothetical protein